MRFISRWTIALLIIGSMLLSGCGSNQAGPTKVEPAKLEPIGDGEYSRVVVTEKAAERLGIETVPLQEEGIERTMKVGGQVLFSPGSSLASGEASAPQTFSGVLLRVPVSDAEEDMVDLSQPANVVPFGGDTPASSMVAQPVDFSLQDDDEDDDFDESLPDFDLEEGVLYYHIRDPESELIQGQGVYVELAVSDEGGPKKTVPYAAVLYGVQGETWVYTNPEPLVFVREPITIEYIVGDTAILSEGPEVGTLVVTLGAAELFGTETGVSK